MVAIQCFVFPASAKHCREISAKSDFCCSHLICLEKYADKQAGKKVARSALRRAQGNFLGGCENAGNASCEGPLLFENPVKLMLIFIRFVHNPYRFC